LVEEEDEPQQLQFTTLIKTGRSDARRTVSVQHNPMQIIVRLRRVYPNERIMQETNAIDDVSYGASQAKGLADLAAWQILWH
jgi:hypothetical protein